jgi:hypothetical protein
MAAEILQFKDVPQAYLPKTRAEAHALLVDHPLYADAATSPLVARMLELSIEHLTDPDSIAPEYSDVLDLTPGL